MSTKLVGMDGNPFTYRDMDGSPENFIFAQGLLQLTGNYVTGGDTIDFTTLGGLIPSSSLVSLALFSQNGNLLFQYVPIGGPATALNAWKVKVNASGSFGSEHAASGYEAAITGDSIVWQAAFRKLL